MNDARERMDGFRGRMDGSRKRMADSRKCMDGSRGRMAVARKLFLILPQGIKNRLAFRKRNFKNDG